MNFIKYTSKENLVLNCGLHTQTVCGIETNDVNEDAYKNKSLFGFSDSCQKTSYWLNER